MIHITIEINGLQQILQAEGQLAEKLVDDIHKLFGDSCFTEQEAKHGLFSWAYDEEGGSIVRLVDLLFHLQALIEQKRDEIPGFTVLVQRTGLLAKSSRLNSSIHQLYLLPEQDGIWCTSGAVDLIDHFVRLKEVNSFFRIEGFNREGMAVTDTPELFQPGDIRDQLVTHILNIFMDVSDELPLLIAPAGTGKRLLVDEVLGLIEGKTPYQPWLKMGTDEESGSLPSFLLRQFDDRILSKVDDILEGKDLTEWREIREFLSIPPYSWSESDSKLGFLLYLKAYARYMEQNLMPPVVAIHAFDTLSEEIQLFLKRVIIDESAAIIPFITLRSPPGQEYFSVFRSYGLEEWLKDLGTERGLVLYTPYELRYPEEILKAHDRHSSRAIEVLKKVREDVRTVYYCCAVLRGSISKRELLRLLETVGVRETDAKQCLSQLVALGLLTGRDGFFPVDPELCSAVRGELSLNYDKIHAALEQVLLSPAWEADLFGLIHAAEGISFSREGWMGFFRAFVVELLSDVQGPLIPFVQKVCDRVGERISGMNTTLRMLASLREGDMNSAGHYYWELFSDENELLEEVTPTVEWWTILLKYMKGEYLWRKRTNGEDALKLVKQALIHVQEISFPELDGRATILLGKIMLTNGRLTEAAEYFRQGRQKTFNTPLTAIACESTALTALTLFMTGDYSLAASHADASEQKARQSGRRKWERYVTMLRGRIEFELGRYGEASKIFQNLMTHEQLYFSGRKHDYFHAWVARSLMYQGYVADAKAILSGLPETAESLFFLAEAQILDRNLEEAVRHVEKALGILEDESTDILPIELLTGDGYEPYENFVMKIPMVYNTIRQILYALQGFLLHELGEYEASAEAFHRLFEQEKISRQDPYRHLYYYFFTITLPSRGEKEELNMVTYLSKSFQSLQKIAGKISEPADRRSYITMNYWNSRLYNLSRKYKLI